jgi:tetratricopeptide (TPR) repeat protein
MLCGFLAVVAWIGLAESCHPQGAALSVADQQKLADGVLARLLTTAQAQRPKNFGYVSWPPMVMVEGSTELNAYAIAIPGCSPNIHITSGLLTRVLMNDPDRTALVLGHELSHILLGHTPCVSDTGKTAFLVNAYTREKEYAADKSGLEIMLAAGYNSRRGLGALKTLDQIAGYSTFDALATDHPATTDRLAALDKEQEALWHSMSAFDIGDSFLATEQYRLAATSFEAVTQQFDDAWDAWNNLGYARLMIYADGLRPDDITEMQLGQVAAGGYFKTAESLRAKARGRDLAMWKQAVAALKYAEAKQPKSGLIAGNLGLAYVIAPDTADVEQAVSLLQKAIELSAADADVAQRVGDEINLAVAYQRTGKGDDAQKMFATATGEMKLHKQKGMAGVAFLFNQGVLDASGNSPAELKTAEESLMQFMQATGEDSPWRPMAYAAYKQACEKRKDVAKPESVFAKPASYRMVVSVQASNLTVYLGQPLDAVTAKLGAGVRSPIVAAKGLDRVSFPKAGVDVIVESSVVTAIVSTGANAIPVTLQSAALGGNAAATLKVGMAASVWAKVLSQLEYQQEGFVDTETAYVYFPNLGIALHADKDGVLQQIVIMQSGQ